MDATSGKRKKIVTLHEHTTKTHSEVAALVGVSLATVSCAINLQQDTGSVAPECEGKGGRKKKTTRRDVAYLPDEVTDFRKTSDALVSDWK